MIATFVRVLLALLALATLLVTPLWIESADGRRDIVGVSVIIDLVALAILVGVAWSWWRSRRPSPA